MEYAYLSVELRQCSAGDRHCEDALGLPAAGRISMGFRIEHMNRRQRLVLVVEKSALRNRTPGHRLPPENAPHLASRSLSHHAVQRRQKVALTLRRLRKWRRLAFEVLARPPVVRRLCHNHILVVRV